MRWQNEVGTNENHLKNKDELEVTQEQRSLGNKRGGEEIKKFKINKKASSKKITLIAYPLLSETNEQKERKIYKIVFQSMGEQAKDVPKRWEMQEISNPYKWFSLVP